MECSYNLIKEGLATRELVWREIKELRTTLVDSFIRFWHQEVISQYVVWKSKKDCFTSLLICMCPWPYLFLSWSLNTFKWEWVSLFHDQFFHALIYSPRCIVEYQSFCVVGLELFVETWKYNNFVLSDTKPNDHIKTQKQVKITKWERKYRQIRELRQDIRLLHTEESQIGFQSWVTNACDQVNF